MKLIAIILIACLIAQSLAYCPIGCSKCKKPTDDATATCYGCAASMALRVFTTLAVVVCPNSLATPMTAYALTANCNWVYLTGTVSTDTTPALLATALATASRNCGQCALNYGQVAAG